MPTTEKLSLADKREILKSWPIPSGAQFTLHEITTVNHKPHPYTIGPKHLEASSGILDESVCRRVPCAHPYCSTSYENHTHETVAVIQVSADGELADVPGLHDYLLSVKAKAEELGIDGFVFTKAPKPYQPKPEELIILAKPNSYSGPSALTRKQTKRFGPRPVMDGYPKGSRIWATVRYDDECRNGHNTFAITADIKGGGADSAGCLHEEIALSFPELAPFIKWQFCSSDGPMHYIANTVYHVKQGKLDLARSSAVWLDASEHDLTAPGLEERLKARLPQLLADFRADIQRLGFIW